MVVENISFSGGGFQVSEEVIKKAITTIFPGNDYLTTLILIFSWYLIGIITLNIFFYFYNKEKMLQSMSTILKFSFAIAFGFISFMGIFILYLPLLILNIDILNLKNNGAMLPFMILAGFMLYACLFIASKNAKGKDFLKKTFKYLGYSLAGIFYLTGLSLAIISQAWKSTIGIIVGTVLLIILDICNKQKKKSKK